MSLQRVFVTTKPEGEGLYPNFLVQESQTDEFIDSVVRRHFGAQEGGEPHEWAAYEEPE